MFKFILPAVLVVSLGACSGAGDFVGSPHGYSGQASTLWADVQGFPTVMPEGSQQIIGTRNPDGVSQDAISIYQDPTGRYATGLAARTMAKGFLCSASPQAPECRTDSE